MPESRPDLDPAVAELIGQQVERLRLEPTSAALRGRLCAIYEANLLWPEAMRCYVQMIDLEPSAEVWRLHHAVALQGLGRTAEALEALEAVAESAALPATLQRLGYLRLEHGDLAGAAAMFDRLIATTAESAAGYLGAGEAALQQGEVERAVELLERALAIDPSAMSAHYQLGLALRKQRRLEDARRELALGADSEMRWVDSPLSAEIRRARVFLTARIDLAATLLGAGRPAEAATVLEEQRKRHPRNVTVLNNLAIAYLRLDRLTEGRALLDEALSIDAEHFTTYINLSSWALRSGLRDEAIARATQATEKAPGVAATHQALAQALLARQAGGAPAGPDSQEAARRSLETAVESGADHPAVYLDLARLSAKLGRQERGYELLEEALERWPDYWPADLQAAWWLSRQGRLAEAEQALDRVREVVPEHRDIAAIERWIAERRGPAEDG